MIDKKHIGTRSKSFSVDVEKSRLIFFARTLGEENKIYTDENVAISEGHPTIPAMPTYLFTMSLEDPNQAEFYKNLGINVEKVLHGEQKFEYLTPVYAGDIITFDSEIVDIYEKKNGALEFIVTETRGVNQRDEVVEKMTCMATVKH